MNWEETISRLKPERKKKMQRLTRWYFLQDIATAFRSPHFHQDKNNSLAVQVWHKHLPSTLCNQQWFLSVCTGLFLRLVLFCKVPHCVNSLNPKITQTKILYLQGCNSSSLKKKGSVENKIKLIVMPPNSVSHDITRSWLFLAYSGFSHSYIGIIVFPPVLPMNASAGNLQLQHV